MNLKSLTLLLAAALALLSADLPVVTQTVKVGSIYPFENHIGTLKYSSLATLSAQSAAALGSIQASAGDTVRKEQTLAVQESAILTANIAAKEAELKRARASEAQAKKDAERYKILLSQNSVSEQNYEQFLLKATELEAAAQTLAAQLEAMQIERARRQITSPFDGIVVERFASVGDYLGVGAPIISVADTSSIELNVYLNADTLAQIKVGDKTVIGVQGREYPAKIAGVSPRGDTQSRTFLTRVAFDKSGKGGTDGMLLEGMEAVLKIAGKSAQNALLISRDAVITRYGQQVVFYVAEGKAQMANVEVIGYEGLFAAVRSNDLKENMQVITKGNERIFPNQAVSVAK
ncbi:hypothetical protein FACS1894103_3330 [Campylobacterota bacterium]|nr:hypothetical protein FACS1894103_3330 [Campylobacterota bacterium]